MPSQDLEDLVKEAEQEHDELYKNSVYATLPFKIFFCLSHQIALVSSGDDLRIDFQVSQHSPLSMSPLSSVVDNIDDEGFVIHIVTCKCTEQSNKLEHAG